MYIPLKCAVYVRTVPYTIHITYAPVRIIYTSSCERDIVLNIEKRKRKKFVVVEFVFVVSYTCVYIRYLNSCFHLTFVQWCT